jgi:hypothetical protein
METQLATEAPVLYKHTLGQHRLAVSYQFCAGCGVLGEEDTMDLGAEGAICRGCAGSDVVSMALSRGMTVESVQRGGAFFIEGN